MKKVIIITGGAGGMGFATAKILSKDNFIILSDIREERLKNAVKDLEKTGIKSNYFVADVTDHESVLKLMEFAKKVGNIISVIHTAGISPLMGDPEKIMKINALATIYVTRAFYNSAEAGANLINVASMAGHLFPNFLLPRKSYKWSKTNLEKFMKKMMARVRLFPKKQRNNLAYSISKNFVIWYSQAMAKQFGEKQMRIMSVSPGTFNTEMGELEKASGSWEIAMHSALKRVGDVEEIAEVLAFCAGEKASYLTGTDILCDGGTVASVSAKDMMKLSK